MAKTITVDIDPASGALRVDYEGYAGNECFQQADKLNAALGKYGLQLETQQIDPKKNEQEMRKLENTQKAGVR
jgi:hypothetical protein